MVERIAALTTLDKGTTASGVVEAPEAAQEIVVGGYGVMIGRDAHVVSGVVRRAGEPECREHPILCLDWASILPVG